MTKAHKISSIIIAIVMLIACIIGVATRLSYKVFDPNVAIYELENINVNIEAIERIELESVLNDLEAAESVFVVYVKKSERCYQTTKVTTKVNRTYGRGYSKDKGATWNGGFASTEFAESRIDVKIRLALKPEWYNTKLVEEKILVPKGIKLNIGLVAPVQLNTGTILDGGAEQVLLPQNWPKEWIL